MSKIKSIQPVFTGRSLFALVTTEDGLTGLGEGTLNSRVEAVAATLKNLEEVAVGKEAGNIEFLWQDIHRGTFWRGGPVLESALSALDAALWDIKGKALNTPVYNLLGGKCRDKIRMYSHCGGATPDELCRGAEARIKQGFTVLRICPHDLLGEDGSYEPRAQVRKSVAFMKALREFVGPDIEIIFEVHTRLTPVYAIELCNSIAEYKPIFVEDPLRADSPESFRVLRSHTNVPLGTGEKFGPLWDYKTLIEEDLIDYVRTDVCNCGGISAMRKIAGYAEAHYIEMVPHGLPSAVGMMAALHTDMATPNFCMQESGLYAQISPCLKVDAELKDGFMLLGDKPGLGIELDMDKLEPFHNAEHPHWRRQDGSVQDW